MQATVLVVEDDQDTRELYESALGSVGLCVACATDAEQALAFAEELHPDAIVTDVMLVGTLDGVQLARRLRADPATAHIPILAVTGSDPVSLGPQATVFNDVLIKPIPMDVLIARVMAELRRAIYLRARRAAG